MKPALDDISIINLQVWKVSIPDDSILEEITGTLLSAAFLAVSEPDPNHEVHLFCESRGVAPKLLGFETILADRYMVVIAQIHESYVDLFNAPGLSAARTSSLLAEIGGTLTGLDQAGYVHGNIRDINIIVTEDDDDVKFMLIDFDWSGILGELRYSPLAT
ncbi:hypothetical protein BDZ97DRAFT_1917722 [Flammula alnicola]|nr:hypothetical protein BDZ97DRAFT_1917722 [Flammula alnicola]